MGAKAKKSFEDWAGDLTEQEIGRVIEEELRTDIGYFPIAYKSKVFEAQGGAVKVKIYAMVGVFDVPNSYLSVHNVSHLIYFYQWVKINDKMMQLHCHEGDDAFVEVEYAATQPDYFSDTPITNPAQRYVDYMNEIEDVEAFSYKGPLIITPEGQFSKFTISCKVEKVKILSE